MKAQSLDSTSGAVLYGLGRVALAKQDYAEAVKYLEGALTLGAAGHAHPLPAGARVSRPRQSRARPKRICELRGEVDLPPADPLLGELSGAPAERRGVRDARHRRRSGASSGPRPRQTSGRPSSWRPATRSARLNLGTALYMQGDADGALEQYREAVRLSPALARAHFGIGVLMEARGQDAEAIEAFNAGDRKRSGVRRSRDSVWPTRFAATGASRSRCSHYAEVLRLNPAVSQASFGYAMGLVRLGRYQEARARLETAMKTFPDQPGFAHALARLLAAAPDDRVRDGARAMRS